MRAAGDAERRSLVSLKHHGWDASGGDRLTPEAYGRRAREMAARGFRILKFDVDVPTPYETDEYNRDLSHPEIEHAAALVAGAREAVGMDVGLAIDCHWNYGVQAAIGLARALRSTNCCGSKILRRRRTSARWAWYSATPACRWPPGKTTTSAWISNG